MESRSESEISKSYSLSYFLIKKRFFWLTYLNLPCPWHNKVISILAGFVCLSFVIRMPIYIYAPIEPIMKLYLGDYAYNVESIHDMIWPVQSCWYICMIYGLIMVIHRSNKVVKMQAWFTNLLILEERKDDIFSKLNDKVLFAAKLYYINVESSIISGMIVNYSLFIPAMVLHYSNIPLLVLLNIHALIMSAAIAATTNYGVNLCFLFSYNAFLVGQKLIELKDRFDSKLYTTNESTHNILSNSLLLISLLKQVYCSGFFWSRVIAAGFSCTFIGQVFLIYLIFFVPLHKIYFFALLGLFIINFLCGQSVIFLSGVYARSKLNDCQKQLGRVICSKDIKLRLGHKMKLIMIAEYLSDRKLFVLLSSLELNSYNYLMVYIEMISYLLLVILNKKYQSPSQ